MSKNRLFIDITNLYVTRSLSGIQRVVRNLVPQFILDETFDVYIVFYDESRNVYCRFSNEDSLTLMEGGFAGEAINPQEDIELSSIGSSDIFLDIDSAWHVPHKRDWLYKTMKSNNVRIISYVYDLVPIILPEFAHSDTVKNFKVYIDAVCKYSDIVFTDSRSTEKDFIKYARRKTKRSIPTVVTGLGADLSKASRAGTVSTEIRALRKTKFILFVGTVEARKDQELLLRAFNKLSSSYPRLNLVYVGKPGWNNDKFIAELKTTAADNGRIHWFEFVSDTELRKLYKECYMTVYTSHYEGYGLPVIESLSYSKPVITSDNSSIYEAGLDFADYTNFESEQELADQLSLYLSNRKIYRAKCQYIKKNFRPLSWEVVYTTMAQAITNSFVGNKRLQPTSADTFQHVMISIRPVDVSRCITRNDKLSLCTKEYVIITSAGNIEAMKQIKSKHRIHVIDEKKLFTSTKYKQFKTAPHQRKNWMLRSSLPALAEIDNDFVMLDDDNLPLSTVKADHFIKNGVYKAYYYNSLLRWHKNTSSYDQGQHDTLAVLIAKNLELLSYSSHKPQIINKQILLEVAEEFSTTDAQIDEWSAYFNFAVVRYPLLFQKNEYTTLNWPAHPNDWSVGVKPSNYTHENYYDHIYEKGKLFGDIKLESASSKKVELKEAQLAPYMETEKLQVRLSKLLTDYDMIHGVAVFMYGSSTVVISSIPYVFAGVPDTYRTHSFNYKIINPKPSLKYVFKAQSNGGAQTEVELPIVNATSSRKYVEGRVDLSIHYAHVGKFQINFTVLVGEDEAVPLVARYDSVLLGVTSGSVDLNKSLKEEAYL